MTEQERSAKVRQLISFYKTDNKNFVPVDEKGREHAVTVIVYRLDLPPLPLNREQERGVARLYQEGLDRIHTILAQLGMVQLGESSTGRDNPETFTVMDDGAEAVRGVLSGVIDTHPLGAVFDIAVYDGWGNEAPPRERTACIICDGDQAECKKQRRHGPEEILDRLDTLLLVNGYYDPN